MIKPISNNKTLEISPIKVPPKHELSFAGAQVTKQNKSATDKFVRKSNSTQKLG